MVFSDAKKIGTIDDVPTKPAPNLWAVNPDNWRRYTISGCLMILCLCVAAIWHYWKVAAFFLFWFLSFMAELRKGYLEIVTPAMDLQDHWSKLGSMYTQTNLTRESDRQIAIAGLARKFADRFEQIGSPAHYYAGLWSHDLLLELLWSPPMMYFRRTQDKGSCPSWSWLYSQESSYASSPSSVGVTQFKPLSRASLKQLALIQEIAVVPQDTANPFGPVKFGRISLLSYSFQAKVVSTEWANERKTVPRIQLHADLAYNAACPEVQVTNTVLDQETGARRIHMTESTREFTFLILAKADSKFHGLILQRMEADYPLRPDDREGDYWTRWGKWDEGYFEPDAATRKFIKNAMSRRHARKFFDII